MLKIKDDVDLKELEKFGFKKMAIEKQPEFTEYILECSCRLTVYGENYPHLSDYIFCRRLKTQSATVGDIDVLFDLIQAGYVEKVGDN